MNTSNLSYESRDPNIRKAKFIFPNERVYTLDFDHNIQMQELKLMIQKAAHLRKNTFSLFSNGEKYTDYNEETFDSLFPHSSLVVFTLEPSQEEENFDETELLLQMNSPCQIHADKFLLYYCYTCNTSICSECFTTGIHKNHKIQDKCFYLLSSKYLVEKLFEKWSINPYEDYNISVDLSQLKKEVNTIMFDKLFQMLKKLQEKCNMLIDEYNQVNINSLGNIRDSVRDIKVACIKALDNLKEELNIKDIVNNTQIFVEFDRAYKELGKIQNSKFNQNLLIFKELNEKISSLVSDLIHRQYSLIYKTLEDSLNDNSFENIKAQIDKKFIKPADKNEIINQLSEQKKRRNSFIPVTNIQKNLMDIEFQDKNNSEQGKNMAFYNNNINEVKVNPFNQKDSYDSNKSQTEIQNKTNINTNVNSNKEVIFGYVNDSNGQSNLSYPSLNPTAKFGSGNIDIASSKNNKKGEFVQPINVNINETKNINSNFNLNSNSGAQIKENVGKIGPYSSAHITREVISTNVIPKINANTSNLFSANNNREILTMNNAGTTSSNLITNTNNNIDKCIINPFIGNVMRNLNNNNNNKSVTTTSIQTIINHDDNNQPQVYKTTETKTTTTTTQTFVPHNLISNIMDNNSNTNINNNMNNMNNFANTINTITSMNNIGNVNKNSLNNYTSNNGLNNNIQQYLNKRNIIQEEMTESETEIRRPTDIRRFLNTQYILCPIAQTNCIKIITSVDTEERTVPLKLPENYGFNSFFLDCAHCNSLYNKCLYVSGGIQTSSSSSQRKSNILLCIDITKPDDLKVVKKASMNYARCGHTMISEGKYIYSVGGEDMDYVERYDIDNDIWEILPNMNIKRMYPILYVNNGYLYAFFGKYKNGEYPCTIERLNISGNTGIAKPEWEMIMFSNQNDLDLKYYGCGLHEINGLLYFFGGKCNEEATDRIFYYNFERRFIEIEDSQSLWKEYFRENKFYRLGERLVQCSESKYFGVYLKLQQQ